MSRAPLELVAGTGTAVPMQPASLDIWDKKYRLKTKQGEALDADIDATHRRVARALADAEASEALRTHWYERFLWALRRGAIPAGRIVSNAGAQQHKPATSTINCTVSGTIADSMDDILGKVYEAGLTLKAGCGIGYEFSTLRPRGAFVAGAGAYTSGPMSFMDIYDKMCFTVSSAGGRRGAQMGTFDVAHPDVREFIRAKREDGRLRQFNLSLLITDGFMQAVEADADWPLLFPLARHEAAGVDLADPAQVVWRDWPLHDGYQVRDDGQVACKVYARIKARHLWDMIMVSTYDYAEPGFILIDRVNEMNNNWWCEDIRATNPCGEQPLPPYGACWTGAMRINTNHGLIRTDDAMALVEQGKPLLIGVDEVFSGDRTDLRPCTLVRNGEKEVLEVCFGNGQRIELTADHRVYTPDGWKQVRELSVGSEVHVQAREMSHLSLIDPFDLGSLKYLLDRHAGEQLVVTHAARRAFLVPLLDRLCINHFDGAEGIHVSRNHAAIREVEGLDLARAGEQALRGYLYAAQATAARYKGKPAVYGERSRIAELADVVSRLVGRALHISRHRKDSYRLLLPELALTPACEPFALDLDFAVYGWLMADGWLTDSAGMLFSDQEDRAMELLAPRFVAATGTAGNLRKTYSGQVRDVYSVACYRRQSVQALRAELGLADYTSRRIRVPEKVYRADSGQQASFLAAAFCADGSIDAEKLCVRLTSASQAWLQDVQLLLLNFGIHGSIQAQVSKGNAFYSLRLAQADAYRYYRYIGFPFSSVKQRKLERLLREKQRWHACEDAQRTEVVRSIRPIGVQPVYDIEEFSTHTLVVNGVVVHNCLLGSVNLTTFVRDPFTESARFVWDEYREVVRVFTRMLDNVVEVNGLPLERQRAEILRKRRHGMGFLGLGSALTLLRMEYGSPESCAFTEAIAREMALAGWETGLALAREKGPAPIMDETFVVSAEMLRLRPEMARDGWRAGQRIEGRVLHARYSRYMQRIAGIAPELVDELAAVGARFTHHSSIAPTGTISLSLANNASNGIEPSFAHHYSRNVIREGKKSKEKVDVFSYELLAYRHRVNPRAMPFAEDPAAALPDYFVAADDIHPEQHVDVQAAAQKWVDSSISKTANVPTDYPYERFKDIYRYAYRQGLKGCTTFRFNPAAFQGVLVKEADLENTTYRFELDDGSVVEVKGNEQIEYDGELHTAANLFDALKEGYYGRF
ncbi:MAG TPA: ribonucleoside-diphosphate reductase [Xanthomonadaceae bacterium]|nr:ribonucleoside-diphosphate reductase [Xanthomonadaceae bacterium]